MVAYIPNNIPYREPEKNKLLELIGNYYISLQKSKENTKKVLKHSKSKDLECVINLVDLIKDIKLTVEDVTLSVDGKLVFIDGLVKCSVDLKTPENACTKQVYNDIKEYIVRISKVLQKPKGTGFSKIKYVKSTLENYRVKFGEELF